LILILALVQACLYGWALGVQRGHQEIHQGANIRVPWIVQLMLKWVVPIYLLAIFTGFCFINLPSHDQLAFRADGLSTRDLAEGDLPEALRVQLASRELAVPATATLTRGGPDGAWQIRDGGVLYVILPAETGLLDVYVHEIGYIEKIGSNPVAFASLIFVLAVLAFLLLMVHIAGRRWEAEGRFENLEP
jgi:uncharacterized membrane protein YhaH (DUF805 family)